MSDFGISLTFRLLFCSWGTAANNAAGLRIRYGKSRFTPNCALCFLTQLMKASEGDRTPERQLQLRYSPRLQVQDHMGRVSLGISPPALSHQIKTHGLWEKISGYEMPRYELATRPEASSRVIRRTAFYSHLFAVFLDPIDCVRKRSDIRFLLGLVAFIGHQRIHCHLAFPPLRGRDFPTVDHDEGRANRPQRFD